MNGHIYFIMGISGSGKWTLIDNIRHQKEFPFFSPLSYKTREIRPNEADWVDSHFISKSEFFAGVETGQFLEYAMVHGSDYYGTKYADVFEKGVDIGHDVVKEIDIGGLKKLKSEKPELDGFYSTIFLNIPTSHLPERIETRGVFMSDEELKRRLSSAEIEEEEISLWCDYEIDAMMSPDKVLKAFLDIVRERKGLNLLRTPS